MRERAEVVANCLAVRPALLKRLRDKLGCIVGEGSVRIGRSAEFLFERGDKRTRGRRWIFGRERHADVGAFRDGRVGKDSLPTVTTDEYWIESLTLCFLQDLATRLDATSDEHDFWPARFEIRDIRLRRRKIGVDRIQTQEIAMERAAEGIRQPPSIGVVFVDDCGRRRTVAGGESGRK